MLNDLITKYIAGLFISLSVVIITTGFTLGTTECTITSVAIDFKLDRIDDTDEINLRSAINTLLT